MDGYGTWVGDGDEPAMAKTAWILVALACMSGSACGILGPGTPTMEVSVNDDDAMYTREDEWVTLYNSRADPNGLAGLEVHVTGIGRSRIFTATDLPSDPFDVPESGTAHVLVRLKRDGEVVAEGIAEWPLAPDVEWEIEVERSPYPIATGIDFDYATQPNPVGCTWFWCREIWRFEIQEDARNYEAERLWVTIWVSTPGLCTGLCEH